MFLPVDATPGADKTGVFKERSKCVFLKKKIPVYAAWSTDK
jgi:hypothetical protein